MTDFLPLLPPDQNAMLFGKKSNQPKTLNDYQDYIQRNLIQSLTGHEPGYYGYESTKTKLPDLSEFNGPREALETLLYDRHRGYLDELEALLHSPPVSPPKTILYLGGWVFYPHSGQPQRIETPLDSVLLYDTETYVKGGNHPIIGIAYGLSGWYVWLHPQICKVWTPERFEPMLIPMGKSKLLIAHNVMFDLSKTKESYSLSNAERHYGLCTMAMHGTISATGGEQVLRAYKAMGKAPFPWVKRVCGDSLKDCLKHHTGREINKEARNLFVNGNLGEIITALPELITYALGDVTELHWLSMALYPKFRLQCPSLVTLCGLLELSKSLLVVNSTYLARVTANDVLLESKQAELTRDIWELCEKLAADFTGDPQDYANDPWLNQLDWTPAKTGKSKGVPAWFRKLKGKVTLGSQVVPLVMRMTWQGQPLIYCPTKKWGWVNEGVWERLPHPDGAKNVGSPLSKHFAKFVDSGVLAGSGDTNLPKEISKLSYWVSYQSRFREQYLQKVMGTDRLGIVPSTKLIGTLTGRQVEKTWLTAAQCKPDKLGSDFYHIIQPANGWDCVLWDEDTEEVRIAALWGDYHTHKVLGSTPMSQIAFMGNKDDGTDPHSVTAKLAGIDRQAAKVANFRDIFGGGRKTQTDALRTAHPDWPQSKLDSIVSQILDAKRGEKIYGVYQGGTDSEYHNQAMKLAETKDFRLPATGRMLPDVVNPTYETTGQFYTSRYNFPVQGTGADILHATAAIVPLLATLWGIPDDAYGYVMARHDEIAYNVKSEYSKQFAELANSAHCWAWSLFLEGLGFNWMPTPLARLSAINIDWVYRKEVDMPTDSGYRTGFMGPDGYNIK